MWIDYLTINNILKKSVTFCDFFIYRSKSYGPLFRLFV